MRNEAGYEALRGGRVSIRGARYFVTVCTHARRQGLNESTVATELKEQLASMDRENIMITHAAVIMPDHLHVLFTLSGERTIGQVVARAKFGTRLTLSTAGLRWQGNYFEHRLRSTDPLEDVVRYLYINPYAAGLVASTEPYPHFWTDRTVASWFNPTLNHHRPFPGWLP
ncbi:MAG: transposase [Opitutus sp.]